jgi:hypothetical protein
MILLDLRFGEIYMRMLTTSLCRLCWFSESLSEKQVPEPWGMKGSCQHCSLASAVEDVVASVPLGAVHAKAVVVLDLDPGADVGALVSSS